MVAVVNCPTCSAKVEWVPANKFRPFCSERCKQIDLGAWAEEKYVIPVTNPLEDFEDDAPPPSQRES
ncbi:MAG: DNA gyrase inhibitor YacG [Oxalicibacterium faecigallinarum]|uniref:DNA gyrase inhibitor YacG n=1 Tax=Oxalicibacterium faecigallinarum TaxID=573741 RepID=UPI0028077E4D|nr:DNA gyrase inhibitor YacG [Oxalicibacterium faecigallinarum]MDQ7969769.1 DNA gyrase inhibitor YacG [Oxalicibacterium faecigallinarum]